jgi:hypothetical protein
VLYLIVVRPPDQEPARQKIEREDEVLVLVDDHTTTKTHSTFLDTIKRKGYDVTVSLATSDEVQLQDVETWLFDKLVVLGGQSSTCLERFFIRCL